MPRTRQSAALRLLFAPAPPCLAHPEQTCTGAPKYILALELPRSLRIVQRLELLPVGHFARLLRLLRADQVPGDQHIVRPDRRAHRLPRRPAGLVIAHAGWRRSREGGVRWGADGRPERGRLRLRLWGPARGAIIVAIGAETVDCRSGVRAPTALFGQSRAFLVGLFSSARPAAALGGRVR